MAHHEFPPLTTEAEKVLSAGNNSIARVSAYNPGGIHTKRVFAAAVIREAVSLSQQTFNNKLQDLEFIAQHLHALPPPPPTWDEMKDALAALVMRTGPELDEYTTTIQRGIAHHCKVQP
jgi:hypothetical protein